ncbi:hypothetical protein [Chlorogloeopsis fritschii]|nr:hypothetical protein [Chlorogloeopsis fritschii]
MFRFIAIAQELLTETLLTLGVVNLTTLYIIYVFILQVKITSQDESN